jgi:DNA-binding NtrC family response regulator
MKAPIPSQHILVVDDEPMVRDALKMLLTFDGHTIELANDGPSALKKLSKGKFDVVFTDLKLQGMLGDALARTIKDEYPQQVVVMVTAYGDVLSPRDKLSIPVDSLISKPFSIRSLRNALKHARELNENSRIAATSPALAGSAVVPRRTVKKKAAHC